jgi:AraC family transcriptional regulator
MIQKNIHIKNMVCPRCIRVVKEELEKNNIQVLSITLGEATIATESKPDYDVIRKTLQQSGFDLIDDKNLMLIEKIKSLIIEIIHHGKERKNLNYSDIIAKNLGKDYHTLSSLFSSVENITIEKYIINQKLEKVKELLLYGELSLSEIAYEVDYSSVAHLSNQFKQVTGMTPTQFKKNKGSRKPIDEV